MKDLFGDSVEKTYTMHFFVFYTYTHTQLKQLTILGLRLDAFSHVISRYIAPWIIYSVKSANFYRLHYGKANESPMVCKNDDF